MKKCQKKKKWVSYFKRNIIDPLEEKHLKKSTLISHRDTLLSGFINVEVIFRLELRCFSIPCIQSLHYLLYFCTFKLIQ